MIYSNSFPSQYGMICFTKGAAFCAINDKTLIFCCYMFLLFGPSFDSSFELDTIEYFGLISTQTVSISYYFMTVTDQSSLNIGINVRMVVR